MSSLRRFLGASLTVLVCTFALPASPVLASEVPGPNDIFEPSIVLEDAIAFDVDLYDPETAPEITLVNIDQILDSTLEKVGVDPDQPTSQWTLESTSEAAATASGYSCVDNSSNRYLYIGKVATTTRTTNKYQYRWQFHPRTLTYARKVGGNWMWQFEICALGGADGRNGWRVLYNASIMAAATNNGNRRIGLKADTSPDGSAATASLSFSAAVGPITVSGSLPTNAGGKMFGQYGQPNFRSALDQWSQTQSFAGWEASCRWHRYCGSGSFQSQVHHGLFEFPHSTRRVQFPVSAQLEEPYCSYPYGVGCG